MDTISVISLYSLVGEWKMFSLQSVYAGLKWVFDKKTKAFTKRKEARAADLFHVPEPYRCSLLLPQRRHWCWTAQCHLPVCHGTWSQFLRRTLRWCSHAWKSFPLRHSVCVSHLAAADASHSGPQTWGAEAEHVWDSPEPNKPIFW